MTTEIPALIFPELRESSIPLWIRPSASQTGFCLLNWKFRVTIKEEEVSIKEGTSCAPPDSLQPSLLLCGCFCTGLAKEGEAQQRGGEKQAQAFQKAEFQP